MTAGTGGTRPGGRHVPRSCTEGERQAAEAPLRGSTRVRVCTIIKDADGFRTFCMEFHTGSNSHTPDSKMASVLVAPAEGA